MMSKPEFQSYDYPIGGKMVVAQATMSEDFTTMLQNGNVDAVLQVKTKLIHEMAAYILENNLVEFTHQDNPLTFMRTIRVRAYLAPNGDIKLLRTAYKL